MKKKKGNYAFIDSQNLNLGIKSLGWKLDFQKFKVYLKEKYKVEMAYIFIGYMPNNQVLYSSLQKAGYVLIFKPVLDYGNGEVKGNVDAELVLQAMIEYPNYDQAIIISSDGDFHCLVKYLYEQKKLKTVMSPYVKTCSVLLKMSAKEKIVFMNNLKAKLSYSSNKKKHRLKTKH